MFIAYTCDNLGDLIFPKGVKQLKVPNVLEETWYAIFHDNLCNYVLRSMPRQEMVPRPSI